MRRLGVFLLVAALVMGALATPSAAGKKKKKQRKVEAAYVIPSTALTTVGASCQTPPIGCAEFEIKPGERFVKVAVDDVTGQPQYASIYVYGFTDGSDTHDHICGASEEPHRIAPGVKSLVVVVGETGGITGGSCPSMAVAGTITATFSNLP
jgi:hypothetical protein